MALHSALLHFMPLLCTFINFAVSDIVIAPLHGLILLPIAIVYGVLNYSTTKAQGYPVYHFLTWEDEKSLFIYIGLALSAFLAYQALAMVTKAIKRPWNDQN